MVDSQVNATTASDTDDGDSHDGRKDNRDLASLDLSVLPPVFVLPTHLQRSHFQDVEHDLVAAGATLTHDILMAGLILTSIASERRARLELRSYGLKLDSAGVSSNVHGQSKSVTFSNDSTSIPSRRSFRVIRLVWFEQSKEKGRALSFDEFTLVKGEHDISTLDIPSVKRGNVSENSQTGSASQKRKFGSRISIGGRSIREGKFDRNTAAVSQALAGRSFMPSSLGHATKRLLLAESTSGHDEASLPEMPNWVVQHHIYACQRSAPHHPPNEGFIEQLKKIRLARTLIGDEIGVRAYSTSIASLASYPYELVSTREILALPGCNEKIASLFDDYRDRGRIKAADEIDRDGTLSVIRSFYDIWGVGAATAREFYHDRGWRDHDDIIEFGWNSLSRHQQIGLKYFDEFEKKMSRLEVEFIASVVTYHAKQIVDDQIQCAIVGGYRRGNRECGDVDIVLSHPDENRTKFLIEPLVRALEEDGWITHTLILSETTSGRGQETLALKSLNKSSGFDTLDKALVVWQDPNWVNRDEDLERDPKAKNPNIHRRVDIIVAPWRVVGCAVLGWTSGTTFQRDMRRYSRKVKGWKFDSSGIRDLGTGRWVDAESWQDMKQRATTWQEAEKRVFASLGLEWRAPEDRNSG